MTIVEALKTGLPLKRSSCTVQPRRDLGRHIVVFESWLPGWLSPERLIERGRLTLGHLTADDWVVKEPEPD